MRKPKLVATILGGILACMGLIAILWWRTSVDEHLGYCKTPTDTCINRQDAALGEPCECHGMPIVDALARDPEKWEPVFGKDHAQKQ